MALFCTVILLVSSSSLIVKGTEMSIARDHTNPKDDILLRGDQCPTSSDGNTFLPKCGQFEATELGGCWCKCDTTNANTTFFEPNNTCVPVSFARQTSECDLLLVGETSNSLITIFPNAERSQRTVHVPYNKTCSLQYGGDLFLQYLDCDGTWKETSHTSANATFEVTPGWSINQINIRSKTGATLLGTEKGRIFRMAAQCRDLDEINVSANSSTCVIFKVEGRTTCPFPQRSPTIPSAVLPPPVTGAITISSVTLPPFTIPTTPTTKAPKPPVVTLTDTVDQTTKRATEVSPQNPDVRADSGAQTTSKKNTFVIAGAAAGGVLLLALIVLIIWRCSSPKKHHPPHSRLDGLGTISSPISQMSRHTVPRYTDAAHFAPIGSFSMRSGSSMDNLMYRRGSDGVILGPDFKRGSIYSDHYPTSPPPRPPSSKRSSINGHVNPGLTLREEIVTMNPLFEGQIVEHKDLEELNCSDFAVHPDQIVLDERKNPNDFIDDPDTYDCPEEILKGKPKTSTPLPVYYVVDDPYPDSVTNTFDVRGRPDGHVYDEPGRDISRRDEYVVMHGPAAVGYTHNEPRRNSNHGILKVGSAQQGPQRYNYDEDHMQII